MAGSPEFRDHVVDLLAPLGDITARAMFGGVGIYDDSDVATEWGRRAYEAALRAE